MSDIFGAIGQSINQDKGFIYGLANNAISYAQSKKAQRRAYEYARLLAQQQYDLTQKGYLESSSNIRAGLENAGFNPMLAIQNGTATGSGSYSSNAVSANPVEGPDLASNALSIQRLKNETQQAESISDANYANADKAKAEKAKIVEELPFVGKKAKADYMKTAMESAKLENDIHYQNEYLKYLRNSIDLQRELGYAGFANAKDIAELQSGSSSIGIKGIGEIKFNPKSWFKRK